MRMSWQTNQQKHILSTNTNDAPLFGSGIEKAIPYQISDTFAIKAKEDGKIATIDIDNGLLVVEYKNGKKDVFDISRQLAKNSGGGLTKQELTLNLFNCWKILFNRTISI